MELHDFMVKFLGVIDSIPVCLVVDFDQEFLQVMMRHDHLGLMNTEALAKGDGDSFVIWSSSAF